MDLQSLMPQEDHQYNYMKVPKVEQLFTAVIRFHNDTKEVDWTVRIIKAYTMEEAMQKMTDYAVKMLWYETYKGVSITIEEIL